jgi:hypothetical protein
MERDRDRVVGKEGGREGEIGLLNGLSDVKQIY